MIMNGVGTSDDSPTIGEQSRLGRVVLLRFDAGQPLTALAPAWAGLSGLLASSSMQLDQRTLVLSAFLLLLVEPLMGGLWELAIGFQRQHASPARSDVPLLALGSGGDDLNASAPPAPVVDAGVFLPFGRPGSVASRLLSALASGAQTVRGAGWPFVAFLLNLGFVLAVASVLGPVLAGVAVALLLLGARRLWQTGLPARIVQAIYDLSLPWLMGMAALGTVAEYGLAPFREVLMLVALYTIAYIACLALAGGVRLPALLGLDLAQLAVVALLLTRQETLAIWLFGLCLVGQLAAHPGLLAGDSGTAYLRRAAIYVVIGMIVAAIALAPTLA